MKVTDRVGFTKSGILSGKVSPGTKVSLTASQASFPSFQVSRPYYSNPECNGGFVLTLFLGIFFLFLASDTGLQVTILIHIDLSLKQPKALKLAEGHLETIIIFLGMTPSAWS